MTEIMYAGNNDWDCDFFETIHRSVQNYVAKPKGKAKCTIPEIMAKDYGTSSNTRRIWLNKTEKGCTDVVERFAVVPDQVRRDHRLELVAVEIQGPSDADSDDEEDGSGSDGGDGDSGGGDSDVEDDDGNDGDDGDGNSGDDGGGKDDGGDRGDDGGDEDDDNSDGGLNGGSDGRLGRADGAPSNHQDDGENNDDTDVMWRQLRKIPEATLRDSPEAMRLLRGLHNVLRPAGQQATRASRRQRLFGQRLPSTGRGNEVREQKYKRPKHGDRPIKSEQSPAPSGNKSAIKKSRSSSPFLDLGGLLRSRSEFSVKREPSASPEVEIVGSRSILGYIDLTSDGEMIDLTEENEE